jgi:uncharacterized protein involved in exopolysaccharide biosynthesis
VREALALTSQLSAPPLPSLPRRTAFVLVAVAGFMAVVCGVDAVCAVLPRFYAKA